jgi:hypothetical protein
VQRFADLVTQVLFVQAGGGRWSRIFRLGDVVEPGFAPAGQPVQTKIKSDTVKPGGETGAARPPPALGMGPEAEKNVLCHIFRRRPVAQHPPGKGNDPAEVTLDEFTTRVTIAGANPHHQRFVNFAAYLAGTISLLVPTLLSRSERSLTRGNRGELLSSMPATRRG